MKKKHVPLYLHCKAKTSFCFSLFKVKTEAEVVIFKSCDINRTQFTERAANVSEDMDHLVLNSFHHLCLQTDTFRAARGLSYSDAEVGVVERLKSCVENQQAGH